MNNSLLWGNTDSSYARHFDNLGPYFKANAGDHNSVIHAINKLVNECTHYFCKQHLSADSQRHTLLVSLLIYPNSGNLSQPRLPTIAWHHHHMTLRKVSSKGTCLLLCKMPCNKQARLPKVC